MCLLAACCLQGLAAQIKLAELKVGSRLYRSVTVLGFNTTDVYFTHRGGISNAKLKYLEPDLQKGMVKIGGEAKDLDALLKYVRQLSEREVFGNVFLQHHEIQQADPEKPLRFFLLAEWKGGAP